MPPFRGSTINSEADRPSRSCLHQEAAIIAFEVARSTPWGSAARSGIWNHGSCMACKCPVNYMTHGATPEKERSLHTHLHASFAWRWEMGALVEAIRQETTSRHFQHKEPRLPENKAWMFFQSREFVMKEFPYTGPSAANVSLVLGFGRTRAIREATRSPALC